MSKLWQARFFTTVNQLRDLPDTQAPEIAFAGRSNAGKSTAINILTNQKGLAFASKTPGRTQHINYFSTGVRPSRSMILSLASSMPTRLSAENSCTVKGKPSPSSST